MPQEERQYRPGERVPGTEYVVIRLEAEGGHGALYLVRHHFLEKKVQMLKTLRGFEPSVDLIERLKREAQMLAAMDHPHIVSVTSGGLTDEKNPRPYFVMERLKGRSLAQILPEAPEGVGVDAALKVTIEVCDALEYVHTRHGVVHRDIKPDNVFLQVTTRNGSITKLLDFGVAHIMDLEQRYTRNNLFLGTPRYASPEQIMGEKPSPQTDLYAVGLLLYELLLGHGPFDDATNFATVVTAHTQQDPPPFPKTRRFPEGLEALVMMLLRKKATERPKSAEWLATQLRQIKRIAEMAEHAGSQDLNKTDLSPMQNVLTGHRAHLTEAGAPLDVPSEPTMTESDGANATAPESAMGYRSTLRMSPAAQQEAPIDRAAATRSLHEPLLSPRPASHNTEELPDARAWTPPPEPAPVPSVRPPESLAHAGLSTSTSIELPRIAPKAGHRTPVLILAGVVAFGVVVGAAALLSRGSASTPAASAPSAASPSAAASSAEPDPAPAPAPAPVPATPAPTASAAATPSPHSSSPPPATPPPVSPRPSRKSSSAEAPTHLPPSGL